MAAVTGTLGEKSIALHLPNVQRSPGLPPTLWCLRCTPGRHSPGTPVGGVCWHSLRSKVSQAQSGGQRHRGHRGDLVVLTAVSYAGVLWGVAGKCRTEGAGTSHRVADLVPQGPAIRRCLSRTP